jgi:hypothetical protein
MHRRRSAHHLARQEADGGSLLAQRRADKLPSMTFHRI